VLDQERGVKANEQGPEVDLSSGPVSALVLIIAAVVQAGTPPSALIGARPA
jgi:hypothetical protein